MTEQNKAGEREAFIDSMCMTWRHDFGLDKRQHELGSRGMTSDGREYLRRQMGRLYDHHVEPLIQTRAAQPAPVVPEGYVLMPRSLTAENGAKGLMLGEFKATIELGCPCVDDDEANDECEICSGDGSYLQPVAIDWDIIKAIYAKAVDGLAAAPAQGQQINCQTCRDSGIVGHSDLCPECNGEPAQGQQADFGDAYHGAREDLAIWKRRALEAEEKLRQQGSIIDHLTLEAQGETRMGEPHIAQGQQVECQECERMARQVKHWQDLAVANRKVADEALAEIAASDQALRESRANDLTTMATLADVRAELSALKAQQVGQEPALWARQCDLDESDPALFVSRERVEESGYTVPFYPHQTNSVEGEPVGYTTTGMLTIAKELPLTGRIGARCKADERWNVPLYTTPQPVPAQDVAGLVEAATKADDILVALTACTTPIERLERKYGKDWASAVDKARTELVIALAAHRGGKGECPHCAARAELDRKIEEQQA